MGESAVQWVSSLRLPVVGVGERESVGIYVWWGEDVELVRYLGAGLHGLSACVVVKHLK